MNNIKSSQDVLKQLLSNKQENDRISYGKLNYGDNSNSSVSGAKKDNSVIIQIKSVQCWYSSSILR